MPDPDNTEFSVLRRLFQPLAANTPEARGLTDDVAVLTAKPGFDLVVTTDAMVEGVHFLPGDPPDQVAQKLLRVNLSDLAAKGAVPYGYQLMTAWPKGMAYEAKALFAKGLAEDQKRFGLSLFGGDTVSAPGPLTLCATLFGHIPSGRCVARSGAKAGDTTLVSGPIGDGHLGLLVLTGVLKELAAEDEAALIEAYRRPMPRLDLAASVLDHASASMDISDGLLADAEHMARASGIDMTINLDQVPVSDAARAAIALGTDRLALMTGGDDYQILCTASGAHVEALIGAGFTAIGQCRAGGGEIRPTLAGKPVEVAQKGWVHRGSGYLLPVKTFGLGSWP